jgi:hypothetical protein
VYSSRHLAADLEVASAYAHGLLLSRTAKGMMRGGAKFVLNLIESDAADIAFVRGAPLGQPFA